MTITQSWISAYVSGVIAYPDPYDIDLDCHKQAVQHHKQSRDTETEMLYAHSFLYKLAQLDDFGDECQHPIDEQCCILIY